MYCDTQDGILGTNMYAYCQNDPVNLCDNSGLIPVETVLDIGGLAWSAVDFYNDPSLLNAAFLLWDVAAIAVPYAPGSYVGKGAKIGVKAFSKADDVIDFARLLSKTDDVFDAAKALDRANDTSKVFRKFTKGNFRHNLQVLTGLSKDAIKGLDAHHIFPKEFADNFLKLGIDVNNPAFGVFVDATKHNKFSQAYNAAWKTFFAGNPTKAGALDLALNLAKQFGYTLLF